MSFPPPAPVETDTTGHGDGPAAHEDLTIAEQLEAMRVVDERRPGEQCYCLSTGEKRWISENDKKRFVVSHGAEHSSDYLAIHGTHWEDAFFHAL